MTDTLNPGATAAFEDLRYRDRAMLWEPANLESDALVADLKAGRQVYVVLEPGDHTRYELLLTWAATEPGAWNLDSPDAREALLVVRIVAGHVMGAALYGWMNHGAVHQLGSHNEWTIALLEWWLNELLRRLIA